MSVEKKVRVRFAPSPTGHLHIGGSRTALFNWLFARHSGGTFILRIEDTDRARSTKEAMAAIVDGLKWLGLDWDEGPYYQSQRREIYREAAEALISRGAAYRAAGTLGTEEAVIYRVHDERILLTDSVYGEIEFDNRLLDDIVLMKSDGTPAYNFACVVDDAAMKISHVIRGEDHLSNTPKQIVLYRALGAEPPEFAHVPLILGPDKTRLSKRHGATALAEHRLGGMLPAAMINYLVLLGWSSGDNQEIFSKGELIERFSLGGISRKSAILDPEKMKWMNGYYIRNSTDEELLEAARPFLERAGLGGDGPKSRLLRAAVGLIKEKVKTLREIPDAIRFFLDDIPSYEEEVVRNHLTRRENLDLLKLLAENLKVLESWDAPSVEACVRGLAADRGVKAAAIIHPARAAVTGRRAGPGLFELMEVMGRERTTARLEETVQRFRGDAR